jgi:hypothetical protein
MNKTTMIRFLNSVLKNDSLSERDKFIRTRNGLPVYLSEVLMGLMLSDGSLERISPTSGARLSVSFGKKHSEYLRFLFKLFKPYINSEPVELKVFNKKTKSYNDVIKFNTVSLPQLVFYKELLYKGKKIIPSNIEEFMTPVVLAHLIMGDGNLKQPDKIIRIYTNSFTKEDVESLAKAIINKLNVQARAVHDRNNQYMITISKSELAKVQNLIKDHMHPSMLYKIDLEDSKESFDYFNYNKVYEFSNDVEYLGAVINQI